MKKLLFRLVIGLLVLLAVAFVVLGMFLGRAIKAGVEKFGSEYTKVDVKLDSASLSLFSGSGKLTKFVVGNPSGFKSPFAIRTDAAGLSLKPGSILEDKVVIKTIKLEAPEISFEMDLTGNNLRKILSNLHETTGGGPATPAKPAETKPAATGSGKKLQVDDFLITGAKMTLAVNTPLGAKSATLALPEIHLTNLGQGPEGISGAELAQVALTAIEQEAAKIAANAIPDLEKGALYISKEPGKANTNNMDKATKALGDFLKKK
jgi:hypothetical protein